MKPTTTRTLNPLPFQDLEPHRFEDLVRQLAYDFRKWRSLEATGRSGADDGQDIRGIEAVAVDNEAAIDGEEELPKTIEREWIFQCKREKSVGPKRIVEIVDETLPLKGSMPYGFILAVACDVSKAARDKFREEMVRRRIEEYALWAKGELEDMLFLPKNDRLLFAYFNISLEPRRRSVSSALRSQISIKKQLLALFDKERDRVQSPRYLLLRDPSGADYPPREDTEHSAKPSYIHCRYLHLGEPNRLCVLVKAHPAWLTPDKKHWDALYTFDLENERRAQFDQPHRRKPDYDPGLLYLHEYAPKEDRCELWIVGFVPLDRVLAIDPHGDLFFLMPHVFVDFLGEHGPFDSAPIEELVRQEEPLRIEGITRKQLFPVPIPKLPYPVPRDLDHPSIAAATPLSEGLAGELAKIVADIPRGPAENTGKSKWEEERQEKLERFRAWRDKTAVPVFAKFIKALRAAGEEGRIAIRSVPPDAEGFGVEEGVELHICIRGYGVDIPQVWSEGRICATLEPPNEFSLTISPEEEKNEQSGKWPKMEEYTQERLEAEVLGLIRRLVGRRDRRFRY